MELIWIKYRMAQNSVLSESISYIWFRNLVNPEESINFKHKFIDCFNNLLQIVMNIVLQTLILHQSTELNLSEIRVHLAVNWMNN